MGLIHLFNFLLHALLFNGVSSEPKNNEIYRENYATSSNNKKIVDGKPRALLHDNCSGSSSAYNILKDILSAHGLNIRNIEKDEQDKFKNNMHYIAARKNLIRKGEQPGQDNLIYEMIRLLNEETVENNEVLFIKPYYKAASIIHKLNGSSVGIARRNKIDRAICQAKDCFRGPGYTVYADDYENKRTSASNNNYSLCFMRRAHPDIRLKVHFDTRKLIKFILKDVEVDKENRRNIENFIFPSKLQRQYYEDLYAFEHNSDNTIFEMSANAWVSLSKNLMVDNTPIDKGIVKKVLLPLRNTKKPLTSHSKSIENIEEVITALKKTDPPLDHYIRMSDFV